MSTCFKDKRRGCWTVRASGKTVRLPADTPKKDVQEVYERLRHAEFCQKHQIPDDSARKVDAERSMEDAQKAFLDSLKARGVTEEYQEDVRRTLQDALQATRVAEMTLESSEAFLASQRAAGTSDRALQRAATAMKAFSKWLCRSRWTAEDVLSGMKVPRGGESGRRRGVLGAGESAALLESVAKSGERCGLDGRSRALIYRIGLETGLRRREIFSLQAGWILDASLEVPAGVSKNRRPISLPLAADLAALLADRVRGLASEDLLFPRQPARTADMIRADLKAAGLPTTDERGGVIGFHSLRHSFASNLAASGVHPRIAQALMRHSDVNLTMGIYTHPMLRDERAAVEAVAIKSQVKKAETA
jgi:integrase